MADWARGFRRFAVLAWAAWLACMATPVLADVPPVALDARSQPIALAGHAQAWVDERASAEWQDVAKLPDAAWAPYRPDAIYPLDSGKTLWIRFAVMPTVAEEGWYLRIQYPALNRATLFALDAPPLPAPSAGDTIPVAQWPVPHRHPLLPVAAARDGPRQFLLRIENPHTFSAPLALVDRGYLGHEEQRDSFLLGAYFGLAALAAAVSALSAILLRDGTYGRYALAVVAMALAQAAATGIGGLFLWPHWAGWNDLASLTLPVLAGSAFLWFFSSAVELPRRFARLHQALIALAVLGVATAVAIALVPPSTRFRLLVPSVGFACLAGVFVLAWAARHGDRYARWMLLALLPVGLSALVPLAGTWGLAPMRGWTLHAMQVAISVELPLLLIVLMLRSHERREHLWRKQGLDRIDPGTGLVTAHVFGVRLDRAIARSKRLGYLSAALVLEIANAERIRRDFDREWADELPISVAGRLLSGAREVDTVARLGEHRFGMLVEGPLTPEQAQAVGQRIVARCLMPEHNKPLEWVAHLRVAQAVLPYQDDTGAAVLERLDSLLREVPADSKRAVYTLGKAAA
jgi:two-component system, sensor histidine kinase LadS